MFKIVYSTNEFIHLLSSELPKIYLHPGRKIRNSIFKEILQTVFNNILHKIIIRYSFSQQRK